MDFGKSLARGLLLAFYFLFTGCSNIQVDITSNHHFNLEEYQSFCWKALIPDSLPDSMDSLDALTGVIRNFVSTKLQSNGYQYEPSDADFVVSFDFRTSLEKGIDLNNQPFKPSSSLINRRSDPALIDNAYALGGARKVASLLVTFEERQTFKPIWSVNISQILEKTNPIDLQQISSNLEKGLNRALRHLPST